MQTLEQKLILEKPLLLGKTRDFLKKKWVKYVGGAIVAGSLMLGGAARLGGQEQIPVTDNQQQEQAIQDIKYKAIGYAYEGDLDNKPDLDFIFEDLEKTGADGQPLRIMVHEDYDASNADMLSKIILRVNNPQQYPWIEVTGKLWPASPYANIGKLNLESIIFKDQQGKEEVFFPKPSSSSFYAEDEQQTMDWIYAPGRNIVSVGYPIFFNGGRAFWDWDRDGWPNCIDPFPLMWNAWDPFIFDIEYGFSHWGNPMWFGWTFWDYWGGPEFYRHRHRGDPDWNDIKRVINRDQLKDPHNREIIRNYAERMHEGRDINHVITPEKIKQIQGERQVLLDRQYQLARQNPVANIRQKDGSVVRAPISAPVFRAPDRTITLDHFRNPNYTNPGQHEITKGSQTQNAPASKGTGSTVTKAPQKSSPPASSKGNAGNTKGSSKGSSGKTSGSTVKKKHEEGNSSYSISQPSQSSRSYAPTSQSQTYAPRTTSTIKTYPSRTEPRLIRPTQQQVQQYSSPRITGYNQFRNTIRSSTPNYTRPNFSSGSRSTVPRSTYSSPRTYSAPKYSGKSSGSYKAPSYRSSGSSTRSSSSHSSGSVRRK
jgi:hypothetical protein